MTTPQTTPEGRSSDHMPVLFLSHGAPPLADDAQWTRELADWSSELPKPKQILMISAHWEAAPIAVSSTSGAPLVYDFWGFPSKYYDVTYDAPVAPGLADDVSKLLAAPGTSVARVEDRGLDHGAYVPLVEMYPDADIPVLQLSMPTLDPTRLYELGRRLAPLRDEGTLIVGSGFTTHNLSMMNPDPHGAPRGAMTEFDHWAAEAMDRGDLDALLDFGHTAPAVQLAHPRTEHWAPLYVALGAAESDGARSRTTIDGYWHGLSKRSWQLDTVA